MTAFMVDIGTILGGIVVAVIVIWMFALLVMPGVGTRPRKDKDGPPCAEHGVHHCFLCGHGYDK